MGRLPWILLFLFYLNGCRTNPPNDVNQETVFVKIFVTTNVDSALIYLNNQSTGKYTPDTLEVKTGLNTLKLEKNGYNLIEQSINIQMGGQTLFSFQMVPAGLKKTVLMENFSNVSCSPCVLTNSIIKNLLTKYGSEKLVVIKFPTNFPSPFDIFYTANKSDANSRMALYNIQTAPTVILDGILWSVPSDSNSIISRIETRLAETPKFTLSINDTISNATLLVKVTVQNFNTAGIIFEDLVLHTVVIEKEILFDVPPGSNGETVFHNVMRKMLPSNSGSPVSQLLPGSSEVFEFQTPLASAWQPEQLKTVTFIQNKKTKEIIQSTISK